MAVEFGQAVEKEVTRILAPPKTNSVMRNTRRKGGT